MANSHKLKALLVPDAETLKSFLVNARKAWRKYHPDKVRPIGRPSLDQLVGKTYVKAWLEGQLEGKVSQGRLARVVKERLGAEAPTEETIKKHAKRASLEALRLIHEQLVKGKSFDALQAEIAQKVSELKTYYKTPSGSGKV